ncbi:MAG: efflux RND transporter periplasmic adaptor subunit [Planctomycetota bacterium]|nr:efflux RND transporter periplasmic adaptor subunit [Planctomycetota bacterium]
MQQPERPPATPKPPKADLGRLQIARGNEAGPARVRGFPWLRLVGLGGLIALGFLLREPLAALFSGASSAPLRTARATKIVPGQAAEGDVAANGYIVADRQASLATVLSGRLVELAAAEGDTVEAGAVVARIQYDDLEVQERQALAAAGSAEARLSQVQAQTATLRAQAVEAQKEHAAARLSSTRLDEEIAAQQDVVTAAREQRDYAVREFARQEELRSKRLIEEGEFDRVRTASRSAQSELEAAEKRLRALHAGRAAWDGQVERRQAAVDVAASAVLAATEAEAVARAAVEEAKQAHELAGILLEKTRIRAPFTGLVIRKDAEKGEVIAPTGAGNSRGSVLTIIDPTSLEVQVELSERRIARVAEGDRAMVFLDADPDNGLPGSVRKIWPRADRSKGSIEVRVTLDTIPLNLRPDMAARVVFKGEASTAPVGEAYVTVPTAAVVRRSGSSVVFIVEGGIARGVDVERGEVRGTSIQIKRGLEGGELVVLDPPASLRSGDAVETGP